MVYLCLFACLHVGQVGQVGQVGSSKVDRVLELVRRNPVSNRRFAIGLGSGATVGVVQGSADSTGGPADFVSDGKDLTGKVTGQLETPLRGALTNVSIELSNVDGIEFAPFPISAAVAVAQTVVGGCQNPLGQGGILISGDFVVERIDEVAESHEVGVGEEVLKALFAYQTIRKSETSWRKDPTLRTKIIQLTIENGVLCREIAFVGFSNEVFCSRLWDWRTVNRHPGSEVSEIFEASFNNIESRLTYEKQFPSE
jgi:hypothetical protein